MSRGLEPSHHIRRSLSRACPPSRRLALAALTALLSVAAAREARADISTPEYNALLAFYSATGGATWNNNAGWGGAIGTVCSNPGWAGVACNSTETAVEGLYLGGNNLQGTIPTSISTFQSLFFLDLSQNSLTGQIPAAVGQLGALRELLLYDNQLSGNIPDIFGSMQFLRLLYLCCNLFTGPIPASIGNATQLQELYLSYNTLSGNFPSTFLNLANMRSLVAESSSLSGTIPGPVFAAMTGLQNLNLAGNQLTGSIPVELGTLAQLQNLTLAGNQLSGNIPAQLGNLTALRDLQLQNNATLSGSLPISLGGLTSLQTLYLFGNSLSGPVPPELGNLASLRYLDLSGNGFSGTLPSQLGNLALLLDFNMSTNPGINGSIPASFGSLAVLTSLSLANCNLSGPLPAQLGNLGSLQYLRLENNGFSGTLPVQLGNLGALRMLNLDTNNFSGSIPTQLGNLTNLEELALGNNNFTGQLPAEIGNLTNLSLLSAYTNQFSGSIPTQLGNLVNLRDLYLGNNLFTLLPAQIGQMTNLRVLSAPENNFSGSIPTQLGNLVNLNTLELYQNGFSGSIPTQLGNLTALNVLSLYGNALAGDIPSSLQNLPLTVGGLDIAYNLLYTNDSALRTFLNSRQAGGDFEATQTIAPASLSSTGTTQTSADLSWPIIRYSSDAGSYHVYYGTSPGSHPTLGAQTLDKTVTVATVPGLESARTYFMVVETETLAHVNNPNIVLSEPSTEIVVRTSGCFGLAPATLPSGFVGDAYNQTITTTGGTAPFTFTVDVGALPTGVSLSTGGGLSGSLAAAGTYAFTIRAEDATGCGGAQDYTVVVSADVNHVAGQGLGQPNANQVKVYDEAGLPTTVDFFAYGAGRWGVNVATGELDGGNDDIVTGPGPGDVFGPQVRGFVRDGSPLAKVNYFAYGTLKYGVNAAAGAIDADVWEEILSGAGSGAVFGPHVRGWNVDAASASAIAKVNFFAYGTLKFGVNVAAGRVDADVFAEILTAPGPGVIFGPQIRGFNYDGTTVSNIAKINFGAFATSGYGASHASADVDGDGYDEIVASPGPGPGAGYPARFRGFDYDGVAIADAPGYDVTPFATFYGGRLGLGDVDRDGAAELLAGAGRDPVADSTVMRYAYDGTALAPLGGTFLPFGTSRYGVNVAGGGLGY